MKCHDARKTLTTYLDNEATPLEQKQVREHIAECAACRTELATLSGLQGHLHRAMKVEAAQVAAPPDAWKQLQARLANESGAPSVRGNGLLHRLILSGSIHREGDRKNKPANDLSQGWSPVTDPVTKQWWHQGLVWAAKWARKSPRGRPKKSFSIRNKRAGDDNL